MYIYQLRSDYIHEDAKLYKEFPMDKFIDDLHCLLTQQTHEELSQLKNLEKSLQNKTKYEQKQILINYIEKHGTANPDNPLELQIELDNSDDYYFFRLSYDPTFDGCDLQCHMYSDVYEEDWESRITYHKKFENDIQLVQRTKNIANKHKP